MTRTQLLVSLAGTIALAIPSAAMAQVGPDPNSPPPEGYYAPPPVYYAPPYAYAPAPVWVAPRHRPYRHWHRGDGRYRYR